MVATSTIEPSEPSIGRACLTPRLAPASCSIGGGGCSWSWPCGISGSSRRPPRSVVDAGPVVWVNEPGADRAGGRPPARGAAGAGGGPPAPGAARGGTGGLSVVVTALLLPEPDPFDDRCAPHRGN